MAKKLIRSLITGFCVFFIAILVFYATYWITYRRSIGAASEALNMTEQTAALEAPEQLTEAEIIAPDYFVARYDGESLAIYSVSDGREEFLYTLRSRVEDISAAELEELEKGIVLSDKQALASFEEDFTS